MKIFSIYDSKAETWTNPIIAQTTAAGIRAFERAANDPNSDFSASPGDYSLMELGEWDASTGRIEQNHAPKNLGTALEMQGLDESKKSKRLDLLQGAS